MDIFGEVAIVSGGGSGIGRAAVIALAARGAKVVVGDIDEGAAQRTVDLVSARGGVAFGVACDVTKTRDLDMVFAAAAARFGSPRIVLNNAGIGGEDLFADERGDWARIIAIDLTAVIDATRIAVRSMQQSGAGGVIVNTASLIGLGPMSAAPVYAAAKAGVVNFSRSLAYLAARSNIRVCTICPELVDTAMAVSLGNDVLAQLRASNGILRPEQIAAGMMELVEDDVRVGAVMRVTVKGGATYATF